MVRTVLTLTVASGEADRLVAAFRTLEILETSVVQEGCLSAELAVSSDGNEAIVTATWVDEAAYERWTSRTDRGATAGELSAHLAVPLSAETVGRIYRVAHHAGM